MKLDSKFTDKLVKWMTSDHTSEEAIREGATLLLQLNRNRGLFERICRNPQRGLSKLEYELKKHLKIRMDGYTLEDIEKMAEKVLPEVSGAITVTSQAKEDELPKKAAEDHTKIIYSGIRPDHDSLPEEIKAIWAKNAERWKKIKSEFELLKTLQAPCDRYEHLKILKEGWYSYKKDMERYDNFSNTMDELVTVVKGEGLTEDQQRDVDYAQSYISRNLPTLLGLVEAAKDPDFNEAERLEEKRNFIQNRVNILLQNGVVLSEQRKADLIKCDISIELKDNAEGEKSE